MKTEPSRPIPRKLAANLELLIVVYHRYLIFTLRLGDIMCIE